MALKLNERIVVGIGHPFLSDDRAGMEVVAALQARKVKVNTAVLHSSGLAVLETILGYDEAVIVWTCKTGLPAGTVLETTPSISENRHHIPESLNLIFKTGNEQFPDQMPSKITIFQVEAEDLSSFSNHCTPAVNHAVNYVVDRIQKN